MSKPLEKQLKFNFDYTKEDKNEARDLAAKLDIIARRLGSPLYEPDNGDYSFVPFEYFDEETDLELFTYHDLEGTEIVRLGKSENSGICYSPRILDISILPNYSFEDSREVQLIDYKPGNWIERFERLYESLI